MACTAPQRYIFHMLLQKWFLLNRVMNGLHSITSNPCVFSFSFQFQDFPLKKNAQTQIAPPVISSMTQTDWADPLLEGT